MVVPYTFARRGVPVREDNYAETLACEVGWPVPFLAAFISPVFAVPSRARTIDLPHGRHAL